MESISYLIYSNAAIDYLNSKLPPNGLEILDGVVGNVSIISVITMIEILGFKAPPSNFTKIPNLKIVNPYLV